MFAPHQCIVGRYRNRYYVRVGSNFEPAPHSVVAGMFGRQPTPDIFVMWGCGGKMSPTSYAPVISPLPTSTPYIWCELIVRNSGVSLVRDLYVNFDLRIPGPNCMGHLPRLAKGWSYHESIGGHHLVSDEGFRLAPTGMIVPIAYSVYLRPPFDAPLSYEISVGCAGSPVHRIVTAVPQEAVESGYEQFLASPRDRRAGFEFACVALGLDQRKEFIDTDGI